MKKEERKRYTNRLKIAKFSAIILLLIQIGFIFVYKLMWDIEKNLGLLQDIFLYITLPLIILSFFLYWGLVVIARKEKLKSLEVIFWIVFGFSVISNLLNLLIFNNYGNLPLVEWASFIIFVTAMIYIIFGLSFFQLQNKFGNIVNGAAIPNILIGIMFLGAGFITISFLSRAIMDIIFLILEVVVFISVIIIFNKAIKSK